jgi:hypothetical protein
MGRYPAPVVKFSRERIAFFCALSSQKLRRTGQASAIAKATDDTAMEIWLEPTPVASFPLLSSVKMLL